jgi:hypothetical protein
MPDDEPDLYVDDRLDLVEFNTGRVLDTVRITRVERPEETSREDMRRFHQWWKIHFSSAAVPRVYKINACYWVYGQGVDEFWIDDRLEMAKAAPEAMLNRATRLSDEDAAKWLEEHNI